VHIAITIFQVSFFLLEVKKPSTHFVAFRILESLYWFSVARGRQIKQNHKLPGYEHK